VRFRRAHTVAWIVVALWAVPAGAQPTPALGATAPPGWLVTPSVAVAGLWDDNVTLAGSELNTLEDFVTAVSPSLVLGYRGRDSTVAMDYRGRYDFYNQLSQFDTMDHRGSLDLNRRVGRRANLFARNTFTVSPTTDTGDALLPLVVLRRRTSRFNDFRGGIELTAGRRTTITSAYSSQWIEFADDESVAPLLRGGYAHMADATLMRQVASRLSVGGTYEFQHAVVSGGAESFDIQRASAVMELALSPNVDVVGSAGYAWLSVGRDGESRDAPTFRIGLKGQRRRAYWDVSYGRSFIPSFGFGGTVQNEEVRASLHVPMGRRFELGGTAAYRENDSLDIAEADLQGVSAQGSLGWAATRWLRLELFAIHSFQDSQLAGGQISRTQAGVRFTTLYPMRLR
jgi:hypothetical protein